MLHSPASSIRVVLCLALGASLLLPPAHALASASAPAPNARERSQLLLAEGDAAFAKDAIEESISKYRASYYGLPPEDQASYLGSLPVRKAMRAYDQLVAAAADPNKQRAILQRQRVLLEEFLDAVAAKPGAAEDLGEEVMTELEATHHSIVTALEPPKPTDDGGSSTDDPGDDPSATVTPTTRTTTQPPTDGPPSTKQRDWLGLGLTIGGGTALATGIGLGIGALTIRSGAQQLVDAGGPEFAPGTDARADYLEIEHARAQKFLIAGSVVAGVGLATTIAGVVHILVHRRRTASGSASAMHLAPALSPTTAGLVLHRRF